MLFLTSHSSAAKQTRCLICCADRFLKRKPSPTLVVAFLHRMRFNTLHTHKLKKSRDVVDGGGRNTGLCEAADRNWGVLIVVSLCEVMVKAKKKVVEVGCSPEALRSQLKRDESVTRVDRVWLHKFTPC